MLEQDRFIHRPNYFDVLDYLNYQRIQRQRVKKTIDRKWSSLRHLLEWSLDHPLINVSKNEPTFPNYLSTLISYKTGNELSPASIERGCGEAKRFFCWAKIHKPKYKPVSDSWIETLEAPRSRSKQSELVDRKYFTLGEIRKLVNLPSPRLIDRRDQAATALLFLTAMRIGAFASLPIRLVDLPNQTIYQLPKQGVQTKNGKAHKTYMLQIKDLLEVVYQWDEFIRNELGEDTLWYPNLSRDGNQWVLGKPGKVESRRMAFLRGLKRMCNRAEIEYKSPHKIRHGYGVYGVQHARTIEELEAISQNMGHETLEITLRYYAKQAGDDVKRLVTGLSQRNISYGNEDDYEEFQTFKRWRANKKRQ